MQRGVVKWFNQVSDYGFIAADEGGPDRYVRGANFAGGSAKPAVGSRVSFEPRDGGMGPEAVDVRDVARSRHRSSGSFEPARRHGWFDPRFPTRQPHAAAPAHAIVADHAPKLDWQAYSARFFPDRLRHDFEALKAFESYGNAPAAGRGPGDGVDVRP